MSPGTSRRRAARAPAINGDRKFVTALARGLEVLRCFTPTEGLLGNGEIAERTGLPKPTVSRLTYTLTKLGYLAHVERLAKYQLAPAALDARLHGARQHPHPPARAHPHAGGRDYAGAVGRARHARPARPDLSGACALQARRDAAPDAGLAPADHHHRDGPRADRRHAGRRARPGCSATSSAQEGKNWPKIKAGIERAIKDFETRGFTLSLGDWERDINAVGVPLTAPDGSGVFAFNCGAPGFQFTRERLESDIGPRLVNMVRNVEVALSGR